MFIFFTIGYLTDSPLCLIVLIGWKFTFTHIKIIWGFLKIFLINSVFFGNIIFYLPFIIIWSILIIVLWMVVLLNIIWCKMVCLNLILVIISRWFRNRTFVNWILELFLFVKIHNKGIPKVRGTCTYGAFHSLIVWIWKKIITILNSAWFQWGSGPTGNFARLKLRKPRRSITDT